MNLKIALLIQNKIKLKSLLVFGMVVFTLTLSFGLGTILFINSLPFQPNQIQPHQLNMQTDIKSTSLISLSENHLSSIEIELRNEYERQAYLAEVEVEVARVESFFESYAGGAVMQGYGRIIVEQARACGGDYRVLVGIAGNESGLGRSPYKLYNPYGYLDGVQYESWEHSLTFLSCEISQRFIGPCNSDLQCIIRRYGGPETNQEKWIRNVSWFMSQV